MASTSSSNSEELDSSRLTELLGGDWATGQGPRYRRLADRLDELIAATEIRSGVRLPPERRLAEALGVSRTTVVSALDLLRERGSVVSRQGSGSRVLGPPPPNAEAAQFRSRSLFRTGAEMIEMNMAVPDLIDSVRLSYEDFNRSGPQLDPSVAPEGMPDLRRAIADRYSDEGLATCAEDILVTSGAQQAISLAMNVLCRSGDVVLTEGHTWPGVTDTARRIGARCHGVPMDQHGIITEELRRAMERMRPAVVVLNPHHHNPTATRLTPHRRREVAELSADYGIPVVEDRVAARLAFDRVVERPLAAERADANILTVDSISKVAWPGVRLGWLRVGRSMMSELRLAKAISDLFTSPLSQAFGLHLLADFDLHVEDRSVQLERRARLTVDLIHELLGDWEVEMPRGGLVLWPRLPEPLGPQLAHRAAECGVSISSADAFAVQHPADDRVRIPFTASEADLAEGMRRLATAWQSLDTDAPPDVSDNTLLI